MQIKLNDLRRIIREELTRLNEEKAKVKLSGEEITVNPSSADTPVTDGSNFLLRNDGDISNLNNGSYSVFVYNGSMGERDPKSEKVLPRAFGVRAVGNKPAQAFDAAGDRAYPYSADLVVPSNLIDHETLATPVVFDLDAENKASVIYRDREGNDLMANPAHPHRFEMIELDANSITGM